MTTNPEPEGFIAGWGKRMRDAQLQPSTEIAGEIFERVRYGNDYPDPKPRCRDCGVRLGEFHVVGCCVERCPKCMGQALTCLCHDEHDVEVH